MLRAGRPPLTILLAIGFPVAALAILAPQAVTQVFKASGYMPHGIATSGSLTSWRSMRFPTF
jgi:hypothetical protein